MYDAVIVGGSLAGATTAIHLAERGREVVIVERRSAYRRKACGEGLFPLGVQELGRLGLLGSMTTASGPLNGIRFHAGAHRAVADMGPGGGGLGVQRAVLDDLVLARARAAGVEIREGVTARGLVVDERRAAGVATDAGDVRARVVIGADGLNSRVRRLAGLEGPLRSDRYGVTAHVSVPHDPEPFVDVFIEDGFELYLTPVGERLVNVGILAGHRTMRRFAGRLEAAFVEILRDSAAVSSGFQLIDQAVAAGPFRARAKRAFRANVVLVGDAAGFLDGITGEGMSTALVSARDCAQAVDDFLRTGSYDAFRTYDARRRSLVRNTDVIGRMSLCLAADPRLARMAVRNLERQPATFRRLAMVSSGERGLRSLRPRDLLALGFGL